MKIPKPYLHLWLDIWLVQIGTELFNVHYEDRTTRYVRMRLTLMHKWGFDFNLYKPN